MKTSSKTEKTKAWRVEKTGNTTVAIYRRDKFHKASGKTYQVFEVADYTAGQRRLQSFSDSAKAIAEAQRIGRLLASGETSAAKLGGNEAASYDRAIELLRAGGLEAGHLCRTAQPRDYARPATKLTPPARRDTILILKCRAKCDN